MRGFIMLERIVSCLCHPRFIGKFHKDRGIKVFAYVLLFFAIYLVIFGAATFNVKTFDDDSCKLVTSSIILNGNSNAVYDSEKNVLKGSSNVVEGNGFILYILPNEEKLVTGAVCIVLNEVDASIYYGGIKISSVNYEDINSSSFSFMEICKNNSTDIYVFKGFSDVVLNSANSFFQLITLFEGVINVIFYYLILLLCMYVFSIFVNPTIDRGIRVKLCMYDCISFFVLSTVGILFNAGWFVYIAACVPGIFTLITFKHIVKVVVRR